ncbi:MAG: DUF1345 domain-containing protein [Rhodospirillales bacterium]|nr:DUF1345 domain-containing protein [Rhodospirillales bacterium]MDE2197789.1 DUF1345 domain-containing protein [Rhodospirillales bacterium]MDE2575295.1 DUF1345 domain-containing protein [Rhodospirillales bacterium]
MKLWRIIQGRPRLALGTVIGLAAWPLLPAGLWPLARAVLAWDIGCVAFLALIAHLFATEPMSRMAEHAARDQEGEWTIFWATIGAVTASFAAIVGLFSNTKDLSPGVRGLVIALVAATLLLSWLITHTLFALRYAHEYYDTSPATHHSAGGLEFPGGAAPDYWDFFYFALVLGMTFQVSDVTIQARSLRRLAAAHGMLGFLFNTVILALSVNIGASLM